MPTKSSFREGLDQLTPEQFQQVEKEIADAKASRGNNAEYRQKLSNMTESEFQRHVAEVNR